MKIKSTAKISLESFNDLIAENCIYEITIQDSECYPQGKNYDLFNLLTIKRAMLDFLKGCPRYDSHNPNTEKEIFAYIYTKLANMVEYDDFAREVNHSNPAFRTYAADFLDSASGLEGTMIEKIALCSGMAETLRNLLAEKGIEARYISGSTKSVQNTNEIHSHAWNQVKLDGEWYNCDITKDRKFILEGLVAPYFLKSNADCKNYMQYPLMTGASVEPATLSLSNDQQQALIGMFKTQIKHELHPESTSKHNQKPGFFKSILTKLHIIKSSGQEK